MGTFHSLVFGCFGHNVEMEMKNEKKPSQNTRTNETGEEIGEMEK